jgi:putative transposase
MRRTFEFRLRPTKAHERLLEDSLETQRLFFNACLQERRSDRRRAKKQALASGSKPKATVTKATEEKAISAIKATCPEWDAIHTHVWQDTVARVDLAFQGFFGRCKAGKTAGYPRFKSFGRYRSFAFKEAGNGNRLVDKDEPARRKKGDDSPDYPVLPDAKDPTFRATTSRKRLQLVGIGRVKIVLHRPYEGVVKVVRVVKKAGRWFAQFSCDEVPLALLPPAYEASMGADFGVTDFLTTRDGAIVPNPRFFQATQAELRRAQRAAARKTKRSQRHHKALRRVAAIHARIAASRKTFHGTVANWLLHAYDLIGLEELNIEGLARGWLSKQVHDVAWGRFVEILLSKAEKAGREVILVNPSGTSQECSSVGCGREVRKKLSERMHRCPHCGLVLPRDQNSGAVIEKRALALRAKRMAGAQPSAREAVVGLPMNPRSPSLTAR